MIGLDTNILLRYLTQDDAKQAKRATDIFEKQISEESRGFISTVVLHNLGLVFKQRNKNFAQSSHRNLKIG